MINKYETIFFIIEINYLLQNMNLYILVLSFKLSSLNKIYLI